MSAAPPDPDGLLYAEHWEPVLAGPARRLLDRVTALATGSPAGTDDGRAEMAAGHADRGSAGWLASGAAGAGTRSLMLLDVGTGTGSLALAAAERWPGARIVGLDGSAGMLSVARQRVADGWPERDRGRFTWLAAEAAAMPLEDASVDIAVSSFVLQLVADRRAALREIWRVLRPGGLIGFVTWLSEETLLPADSEFDEAVYDLDLDEPEADLREPTEGDYENLGEAAADLAAAGFESIDVQPDRLEFAWQRQAYRAFKEHYDERDLFDSLTAADRARLLARLDERWAALHDDAFFFSAALVAATARRPPSESDSFG
ncbi:MAG TPA: class I SAM-dependent methyltransferase, partial [Candidatus Limnocylindrales bacterium]|nr:class I SAM-dependent methyltransferase [Candidatus Limnocylindrales bacterium]